MGCGASKSIRTPSVSAQPVLQDEDDDAYWHLYVSWTNEAEHLPGRAPATPPQPAVRAARPGSGAVRLSFLLEFVEKRLPLGDVNMPTWSVALNVIHPATADTDGPYATLPDVLPHVLPYGSSRPYYFVSHAWSRPLRETVSMLAHHFRGRDPRDIYLWIDIFAVRQTGFTATTKGPDVAALDAALKGSSGVLLCLDETGIALRRTWCLYEAWMGAEASGGPGGAGAAGAGQVTTPPAGAQRPDSRSRAAAGAAGAAGSGGSTTGPAAAAAAGSGAPYSLSGSAPVGMVALTPRALLPEERARLFSKIDIRQSRCKFKADRDALLAAARASAGVGGLDRVNHCLRLALMVTPLVPDVRPELCPGKIVEVPELWDMSRVDAWLALPESNRNFQALAIYGPACSGKTLAAAAVAHHLAARGVPLAAHFCNVSDVRTLDPVAVVVSLALQLAQAPRIGPRLLRQYGELPAELMADLMSCNNSPGAVEAAVEALLVQPLQACVARSDSSPSAPLVVYVSKMVAVPRGLLPRLPGETHGSAANGAGTSAHDEVFLGFGRVFSGIARPGQRVHVLSGAYNPADPTSQRQSVVLGPVYLMMGRALERVEQVPAGNVLAISGLDPAVLKSATLASTPACRPLAPLMFQAAAIVMVAVEPARPNDLPALVRGLQLLNRADPFVEISVLDSGEHVLGAAGEVHLGTCIKDLQERFARVELRVSPPLVAFRESVFCPSEVPEGTAMGGLVGGLRPPRVVEAVTPNGCCVVRVRATALPGGVAGALDGRPELLRRVLVDGEGCDATATASPSSDSLVAELEALRNQLRAAVRADGPQQEARLTQQLQRAWLLGPKRIGPNILLAPPPASAVPPASAATGPQPALAASESLFDIPPSAVVRAAKATTKATAPGAPGGLAAAVAAAAEAAEAAAEADADVSDASTAAAALPPSARLDLRLGTPAAALALGLISEDEVARSYGGASAGTSGGAAAALGHVSASVESGVVAGFQIATSSGPLCEEPLWGVAFELEVRLLLPQGPAAGSSDAIGDGGTATSLGEDHGQTAEGGGEADSRAGGGEPGSESGSGHLGSGGLGLELQEDVYGPFSGQVMTAVALACRRAVMEADARLVEAQYLCQLTASAEALSGMYAVLGRRRARILREEMREGSDTFLVSCYLPVEASFGLAEEMRRRSSGAASASLMLSHWERLQVDPFFVPTTEEEREEHGEDASGLTNLARRLIDAVRRRKGLPVEEKVVAKATKQRTLKRNV